MTNKDDELLLALAQFGCYHMLKNILNEQKLFTGVKNHLFMVNKNEFEGSVNVGKCVNFIKATFLKQGIDGIDRILDNDISYSKSKIAPLEAVNHIIPDTWQVVTVPQLGPEDKGFKLIVNWRNSDKYRITQSASDLSHIDEYDYYYVWRENIKNSYLLHKGIVNPLSYSAALASVDRFVTPYVNLSQPCSFFEAYQFSEFLNKGVNVS